MIKYCWFIFCFALSPSVWAQFCEDIFPDGVSNSQNRGSITFQFDAQVINSPDGILETTDINDFSGGVSCEDTTCTASGDLADQANFNSFSNGQPDINLGFQETRSVTAGDYDDLSLGTESVLTMAPGVYTFNGDFTMQFASAIVVGAPGTVVIYVDENATLNTSSTVNAASADRYVFLFSRSDVILQSSASFNGTIFARDDVVLNNEAIVTGAINARDDITLQSGSTVVYDINTVAETDYNGWCTFNPFPNLIAEWRLDELSWNGSADEVQDNSGNGLHGQAVATTGGPLPNTDFTEPVFSGDPGTCSYGDFNGTADGYVEIQDPGINSILDLDDELTVSTWIYARRWPSSGLMSIVSKDENFEFHLTSTGRINWWWGGGSRSLDSTQSVSINEWHHVAITFESGEQHIYLDGVSIGTNNSTQSITVNNDSVFIGTDLNFHSRRFDGWIDEVRIYDGALTDFQIRTIMNETHECVLGETLDSFEIDIGGGRASVCEPFEISISARDASDAVLTGYAGTIALSTSTNHSDWVAPANSADAQGNLVNGASDSGNADYAFEASGLDVGEVRLGLDTQHAETLTITVTDSDEGISSTSDFITFSENAFSISENDVLDVDVIAGREHQFIVQMLEQAPDGFDGDDCVVASNYNQTTIKAWANRSSADPGGANPTLKNSDASDSVFLVASEIGAQVIDLNFSSGEANFSLETTDVGQYSIDLLDDSLSFSDNPIQGSSDLITARPFAFIVSAIGNPQATDEDGDVYLAAGEPFSVSVEAVAWHTSDDSNDDGRPDTYQQTPVDPSDDDQFSGTVLPSFGLESPAETLTLSSNLIQPIGGTVSGLGSSAGTPILASGFSAGATAVTDLYYPEVGIIQINAAMTNNYLGANSTDTEKSNSQSSYVGRFIPSYFDLVVDAFDDACGSFTYLRQAREATFLVTAFNALGDRTLNYENDFAKLNGVSGNLSVSAIDSAAPTPLSSRLSTSELFSWNEGIGNIESTIILGRSVNASGDVLIDGPYSDVNFGVNLTDADGVTLQSGALNLDSDNDTSSDSVNIGAGEYRFGRLVLPSAHGPESAVLTAHFTTQYWNGRGWLTNASDSCTQIAASDITFPDGTIDVAANLTTSIGAATSTGSFSDLASNLVSFTSGDSGLMFSPPGAGNVGFINVNVDVSNYAWLQFDWNQDGSHNDDALPSAEFRFGSYRGHDRIIYWQEVLSN